MNAYDRNGRNDNDLIRGNYPNKSEPIQNQVFNPN